MILVSPATMEQQLVLIEAQVLRAEAAASEASRNLLFVRGPDKGLAARHAAEACKAATEARFVLLKAQEVYLRAFKVSKARSLKHD